MRTAELQFGGKTYRVDFDAADEAVLISVHTRRSRGNYFLEVWRKGGTFPLTAERVELVEMARQALAG